METASKKLLSIVIPVFNEEQNIIPCYEALQLALKNLENEFHFEFIFTDNHSSDKTYSIIEELAAKDNRIKVASFSKNVGYQKSILFGYRLAQGDIAVQLDVDLQDPPALISSMVNYWKKGFQVVYGIRVQRKESWLINTVRKIFYRLINFLSEEPLPLDAGDFRLVDRKVLEQLRLLNDASPYLRGSITSLGFNQIGFEYERNSRERGVTKFSFGALIGLGLDGIMNHSIIPLRIATFVGIITSAITAIAMMVYMIGKFVFDYNWPPGFTTLTVLILLSISMNALFLGVIGEYIGRIYKQVKNNNMVIVQKSIGINN
ncbi:MAG: glycosyltransferase family 2 protein [Flavobacteriales bacterium]